MRFHLRLYDHATLLMEQSVESMAVEISAEAGADFRIADLAGRSITLHTDGYHAWTSAGQKLRRRNVMALGEHRLCIDLYPHLDAIPKVPGACPSCGGNLKSSAVGGAYRAAARSERRCLGCGCRVVELIQASSVLGPHQSVRGDHLHEIQAAARCPTCVQPMGKAELHTQVGNTDVEVCRPCELIVLEPEDMARLGLGGASSG